MPLNWCGYYYKGFEQVKDTYGLVKKAMAEIIDLFDLYVSSQSCGVRKPNKEGLILTARTFGVDV